MLVFSFSLSQWGQSGPKLHTTHKPRVRKNVYKTHFGQPTHKLRSSPHSIDVVDRSSFRTLLISKKKVKFSATTTHT